MKASQQKNSRLVLSFGDVDRAALPIVGGKAANLGELTWAGLPVPAGFCVTTAAYELVAGDAGQGLPTGHDMDLRARTAAWVVVCGGGQGEGPPGLQGV